MLSEHQILRAVAQAKADNAKADELISAYVPFIRSEASKAAGRICTEQDDEYSIAMIAFHEAIMAYERARGAFLPFAALRIRSRIADYKRKESRHWGNVSTDEDFGEDGGTLLDTLADSRDHYDERDTREATRAEIAELSAVMARFGLSFTDVAENCPKQERTLSACAQVIREAAKDKGLLNDLLRTGKLPMARLCLLTKSDRKTLERHRKYILAMLLIQTNGYEIIRGHLRRALAAKGGEAL